MPRLLFQKCGRGIWISHLDLMRLFQRAFKRSGLALKHSQGFRPRPLVSIALPLSVGVESVCELLDFELEGAAPPYDRIKSLLNDALVEGIQVLEVYDGGRPVREIAYLETVVTLEYDQGVPDGTAEAVEALFAGPSLVVEKKGKSGVQEQDILPMIRRLSVCPADGRTLELRARICCQNPALSPMLLASAIDRYLPERRPDFSKARRVEIYDASGNIFR